jgi:3-deoxy-D-manno-octulosonate 8-phosphate phosphatase (KDO 8-P phosphatase)
MNRTIMNLKEIDAIIFDFDGVLTDNKVLLDEDGKEWVTCHRGDGLAFDVFKKLKLAVYILSTEKNSVVTARGKKLQVPVLQGVSDKVDALTLLSQDIVLDLSRTLYVGNDLNDLGAIKLCGYSACPADSHNKIKKIVSVVLKSDGGQGVARELLENILNVNIEEILYKK